MLKKTIWCFWLIVTANLLAQDFQVSETGDAVFDPHVAVDSLGNFVLIWSDIRHEVITAEPHGGGLDVYGQRFLANGSPIGTNFRVNDSLFLSDTLHGGFGFPSLAMNPAGHFIVSWARYRRDEQAQDVFAQLYNNQGNPIGENIRVNDDSLFVQFDTQALMWNDGSYIIFWKDERSGELELWFQRFDTAGNRVGINQALDFPVPVIRFYKITKQDDNRFMVLYNRYPHQGHWAKRYNREGVPIDSLFTFSFPDIVDDLRVHDVAFDQEKNIFLAGAFSNQIGTSPYSNDDVFLQKFDTTGTALSEMIRVNDDTTIYRQVGPSLAIEDTNLIIAWSDHRDGYQIGSGKCHNIYAQRLNTNLQFIDNNFKLTHEVVESSQRDIKSILTGNNIYAFWNDGRSLIPRNIYPPAVETDIWGVIQPFSNPLHGIPIPCTPDTLPPTPPVSTLSLSAFPNPFNADITFTYQLPEKGYTRLTIYDVLGREVLQLIDREELLCDCRKDFYGLNLPQGIYFAHLKYRSESGKTFQETLKLVVIR